MPYQRLVLFLLVSFLLSSCVSWNIGERIRLGGVQRVGVEVRQSADGLYETPRGKSIMRAWEVRYSLTTPLVTQYRGLFADHPYPRATRVRRTGRQLWAEVEDRYVGGIGVDVVFVRELESLPRGSRRVVEYCPPELPECAAECFGTLALEREPGLLRRTVAAPFDYLIDPALSLTSSAVVGVVGGCFVGLYYGTIFVVNGLFPETFR